jgi:hypothetical protein
MAQGVYFRDFGDRHWRGPALTLPTMISVLLEQEHRDFSKRFILSADVLRRCCAPKSLVELRSAIYYRSRFLALKSRISLLLA